MLTSFFPDVTHLEMMCFYGCLAVLANYLAFIMLYPACLALFLEVSTWLFPVLIYVKLYHKGNCIIHHSDLFLCDKTIIHFFSLTVEFLLFVLFGFRFITVLFEFISV